MYYIFGAFSGSRRPDNPLKALDARRDHSQRRALDEFAPSHVAVPSGSCIAIDYGNGDVPVLAVKLQEMFGATATPAIAHGKV